MSDRLEQYHAALALKSAGIGLLVLAAILLIGRVRHRRPFPGHQLVIATIAVLLTLGLWSLLDNARALALVALTATATGDRRPVAGATGAFAVVSLAGAWAAVPDTEAPLTAAAIVTVVVGGATIAGRAGGGVVWRRSDQLAAALLVAVVAIVGSAGRSEFVGGLGCIGLLAGAMVPAPRSARRYEIGRAGAFALHLLLVFVASRVLTRCATTVAISADVAILVVALVVGRYGECDPPGPEEAPGSPRSPAGITVRQATRRARRRSGGLPPLHP